LWYFKAGDERIVAGEGGNMDWLEQNIDAYRILADILTELRGVLASGLKEKFGKDWASEGLPATVFDELVQTKENETAVQWYEDEYQELFNYTTFSQLHDILQASPGLFPSLSGLVPTPSLLTARFMELEVLRLKVGRVRPIGEVEVNFLMKFHLHFRRAMEKRADRLKEKESGEPEGEVASESESGIGDEPTEALDYSPGSENSEDSVEDASSSHEQVSDSRPRPPQRMATSSGSSNSAWDSSGGKETEVAVEAEHSDHQEAASVHEPLESMNLASMLKKGDTLAILRELFIEVTRLAENLWSSDAPETPTVWNVVRVSDWYEENFVPCGLKTLSDFYDIVARVEDRLQNGLARHELQKLLEEAHFAQILLNLRDMFQKNGMHS